MILKIISVCLIGFGIITMKDSDEFKTGNSNNHSLKGKVGATAIVLGYIILLFG